jgi:hypothetical protein
MAIQSSSIDSTSKCSATTAESTPSTSDASQQQKQASNLQTAQKQLEQSESLKSEKSLPSVAVYREFLLSDLKFWTFQHQGQEYTARCSPALVWAAYFCQYADLEADTDWTDLEERTYFLTQLWQFCAAEALIFPLTEKLNETVTIS